MRSPRAVSGPLVALLLAASLVTLTAAQDATPGASEAAPGTASAATPVAGGAQVAAAGLTNPRGFAWDDNGVLYVALAGSGGTTPATGEQVPPPVGPYQGGPTASVVAILDGCPVTVTDGLPSAVDVDGAVLGVGDVAFLDGQLYVLVAGGGASHGNPESPAGVYAIEDDGTATLVADIGAWHRENPVTGEVGGYEPDASLYAMVANEGALWVSEANSAQVLTVTTDGTIERIADLSENNIVPTALAVAPGGGVYLGYLTNFPFIDGTSKISEVAPDGSVTDVWTGLSTVTGVAVGPDGTLYAAEMATGGDSPQSPLPPGSGRVVRQTGPGTLEEVATGLQLPIALDFGPDDALYLALPAIGADNGEGAILQLNPAASGPVELGGLVPPGIGCLVEATPTAGGTPAVAASPAA